MSFRTLTCAAVFATVFAFPANADPLDHAIGKALFDRIWTSAPAVTKATDGLGPLFNARSCATCHPKGGRGNFSEDETGAIDGVGVLLRIGDETGAGDPVYGTQLQILAVQGLKAEGRMVRDKDGAIRAADLNYGDPAPTTRMSGRLAPTLLGLGLIARIPDAAILAKADPEDADGDGISGRANRAPNEHGDVVLSRFGWKAGKASIAMQSAAAFHGDIGMSNPIYGTHSGDCTESQTDCMTAPHGANPQFEDLEIDSRMFGLVVGYVANLRPPKTTDDEAGRALFGATGCADCHTPSHALADGRDIAPFSDFLVHDMGDVLADGIGDGEATGREWRTAPLWGLKDATRYLHDGRARTVLDAIQFHGGEAAKAQAAFTALSQSDRERLLAFLSNL